MIRAVWNGVVLAEAERTVSVEGNHYFPPESLRRENLTESAGCSAGGRSRCCCRRRRRAAPRARCGGRPPTGSPTRSRRCRAPSARSSR
ncbi:DUF427 domain-containing protein [Nocardiopsis mwathae]|uniref:DUF427 domain-containing protein n=1 Tax=Nocardiopsis mwathae TaxID=1472723 RepID=UPI00161BA83A|nr:DUF427 domain-containing protein [Nocardiopsis mwathae]